MSKPLAEVLTTPYRNGAGKAVATMGDPLKGFYE
jgi:hypothetical protein